MLKAFRLLAAIAMASLVGACATPTKMGLTKETTQVDVSTKSLVLMSLRLDHAAKPGVTPYPRVFHVELPNAESREHRHNFLVDAQAQTVGPDGQEYLVRMDLAPGKYKLMGVSGGGGILIFPGFFLIPLVSEFDVKPNAVIYAGRIEAATRARGENEFRAGPLLPLLDQSMTGWSTSTWDIKIRDAYESDLARFRASFPALAGTNIEKGIILFDRDKAQAWWDKQ